ncbi:HepT-like ribonuclease domain-containing protein [Arthrobacter polaris]|uniref:HepT-like ribonuclease domain-containing protein n=1 Tax=Arthrobacter polaris TaxID=2813727 RepID=UPI0038993162
MPMAAATPEMFALRALRRGCLVSRRTEQRMVDILVHQHFGVDVDKVRDVIQAHLPPLRRRRSGKDCAGRSRATP